MDKISSSPPPILSGAGALLSGYDVVFCDVWGVVHDGFRAYAGACDALTHFRRQGGTVVLVSNAPVPSERVAHMLDARRVPRDAWDRIVSSGEIALGHIAESTYERAFYVGPQDRDKAFFERAAARSTPLAEADAIVCTGLNDDTNEKPEDYLPLLEAALARGLPFVCANPDLVVDVGGRLYFCAGAIADIYQHMGGVVFWAGKPYPAAYQAAREAALAVRGQAVENSRVLVIGDALRTDIAGAAAEGLDALFIAAGIHREETMTNGAIVPDRLEALFANAPRAIAAMPLLTL